MLTVYNPMDHVCHKYINFIFLAEDKHYKMPLYEALTYQLFMETVQQETNKYSHNLKVFIKIFREKQPPKYIKLQKEQEVRKLIYGSKEALTVELFLPKKQDTIKQMVTKIGDVLNERQKELKELTNKLEDEMNQFNALNLIKRNISYNQEQEIIKVFLVVCDPLTQNDKKDGKAVIYPLFHDQIDIPSHMDRLRKSSLAYANLTIKTSRVWGTREELFKCMKCISGSNYFSIIQIFTRVQRRNGVVMMSLQDGDGSLGLRVWEEASVVFRQEFKADILIIVGVGVQQLKEIAQQANFTQPLILISTISLQNMHIISTTHDRSFLDIENTYTDRYCQVYLDYLYSNLFSRKPLGKAHQKAIAQASQINQSQESGSNKTYWCCCLHPHHGDCHWNKIVRRVGQRQAHRLFKHDQWPGKPKQFPFRQDLQALLLDGRQHICNQDDTSCCYKKMGRAQNPKAFHGNLKDIIFWNGYEPNQIFSYLQADQTRPNKFDCESFQKPMGRGCPLTVFQVIQKLLLSDIAVIRAPMISQAKRFFSYARDYIQTRKTSSFFEYEIPTIMQDSKRPKDFKHKLKESINQHYSSFSNQPNSQLFISLQYSHEKLQRYYEDILRDFFKLNIEWDQKIKLKLVLLTEDQQFGNKKVISMLNKSALQKQHIKYKNITLHDIEDPQPLERYHYYLSQYKYESAKISLESIRTKIINGQHQDLQQEVTELQELKRKDEDLYMYLGFLSQFNEDGFYLSKVSELILSKMFNQEVVGETLRNNLPVSAINMGDTICLQLHKYAYNHFSNPNNVHKIQFQQKRLQFYYLRMRLYFQYWPRVNLVNYPGVIRNYISKEGIFSIDIERQNTRYDRDVQECRSKLGEDGQIITNAMHDVKNQMHVYHLIQVQKILQEFLKKRRNKYGLTKNKQNKLMQSWSYIDPRKYQRFQYLLWNIILKSWLMSRVLSTEHHEAVKKFEGVLLIFFIQAQISLPIAEVARIQLYVLMNKSPPKTEDQDFGKLTQFLRFYRNFAFNDLALFNAQPEWGSHRKCKQLFGSCFFLALKLSQMIESYDQDSIQPEKQKKQYKQFKDYIQMKHRMFSGTSSLKWVHECLKLTERKVLYYFKVTSQLRRNQTYQEFQDNVKAFQSFLKLSELEYQFDKYKHTRMDGSQNQKNTYLIDYYFEVQKVGKEVQEEKLQQFKGKISPEYMPIFNYLCQKIQQKLVFNQSGLVIFSRARTIVCDGTPYIYTRRRTLLTQFLGKIFTGRSLKISYCPLTDKTLDLFGISKNNYKCEVLCMILTIDASNEQQLLFGCQNSVQTTKVSIYEFAKMISRCRIKILILCGRNSTKVCDKLREMSSEKMTQGMAEPSMTHSLSNSLGTKIVKSSIKAPQIATRNMQMSTLPQRTANSTVKQTEGSSTSRSKYSKASGSTIKGSKKQTIVFDHFPTIIAIQSSKYGLGDIDTSSCPQSSDQSEVKVVPIVPIINSRSSRPSIFPKQAISIVDEQVREQEEQNEKVQREQKSQNNVKLPTNIDQILKDWNEDEDEKDEEFDIGGRNLHPYIFDKAVSERSGYSENVITSAVQNYIGNQVHSIAMDLMVIAILRQIVSQLSHKSTKFDQINLRTIIQKSKNSSTNVLRSKFDCVDTVFNLIHQRIWINQKTIAKIEKGEYQNLTKKFYCAQNNLHDQNYYQNIGNCVQLQKVFDTFSKKINCIEIVGSNNGQKSSLLQQICWTAQVKGLFKFGIIKTDLRSNNLQPIKDRTFKNRQNDNCQTGILIAIDHIDEKLAKFKEQLSKLSNKAFTIIYTVTDKQCCEEIRRILNITTYEKIDLDSRSEEEYKNVVYASMLAQVKEKSDFSSEQLEKHQKHIDEIFQTVFNDEEGDKLGRAMEMLRGSKHKNDSQRSTLLQNFYKTHYEQLFNSLQQLKQIRVRII